MKKIKLLKKNYCIEYSLPEIDKYGNRMKYKHYEYYKHEVGDKLNEVIKTVNLLSEANE